MSFAEAQHTLGVNPRFVEYSQSRHFTGNLHLATQASASSGRASLVWWCPSLRDAFDNPVPLCGCAAHQGFRALLILLHTCRSVHVFGFHDTARDSWYYDKATSRLESDKQQHQGIYGEQEAEQLRRRELVQRHGHTLPTGHKMKVERECMGALAARGIIHQH